MLVVLSANGLYCPHPLNRTLMLIPTPFIYLFIQPVLTKHLLQLVQGLR